MRSLAMLLVCSACSSPSGASDGGTIADAAVVLGPDATVADARPQGPPPDANLTVLSCADLQAFARVRVSALATDCNDATDCDSIGYQPTCNGYASLTGTGCDVVAGKAAIAGDEELHHAAFLIAQRCFCDRVGCIYDCAPSLIACESGHCVGHAQTCDLPPDAG